jgi:hypothetical protein
MAQNVTRWMISDTVSDTRTEIGPFGSGLEAEVFARRAGTPFILKYDVTLGDFDEVEDAKLVIIELPGIAFITPRLVTQCDQCTVAVAHESVKDAEMWGDIHEFEHLRHRVRFLMRVGKNMQELVTWRKAMPAPQE